METGRRTSRVSAQQLEMIWDFLNSNKDIATAYNRSLLAKQYAKRKWTELAEILNSQGDGTHKDWKGWSKYWVDYKAKLKARVATVRSSHVRTGGGPSNEKPLSEVEIKFLQILGEDFGEGLPGVRVEPFPGLQEMSTPSNITDIQDSPVSESIIQFQDPLILNIPVQTLHSQHAPETPPQTSCLSRLPDMILSNPQVQTQPLIQSQPLIQTQPPVQSHPQVQTPTRTPRRRRQRREPAMTFEATRRALVSSSQMRADAAVRSTEVFEKLAKEMAEIKTAIVSLVSVLTAASPTIAGRENSS